MSAGHTLVTGAGAYARMEMTDGGEMVLRPDSQLKVESYKFVQAKPAEDSFIFSMLKGGLRTVTGLIGKRGDKDAYELKTFTATIGIRGPQFDLRVCDGNSGQTDRTSKSDSAAGSGAAKDGAVSEAAAKPTAADSPGATSAAAPQSTATSQQAAGSDCSVQ